MRSDNILKADLIDLVFENRNKQYGAYELRKNYRKRLLKALLVGVIFAGGVSSLVFMVKKETKLIAPDTILVDIFSPAEPKPAEPAKPKPKVIPPKPQAAPSAPKQAVQQWTEPVIVDDLAKPSKLSNNLDDVAIGNVTKPGEPGGSHVVVPAPTVIDGDGNEKTPLKMVDRETPLPSAEVMPSYPGGTNALRKFLEKNLNSPEEIEEGKVITVRVKFIVGYDGKLKGFEILEDGGAAFNKEVIRVLKKMPEWIPGKSNGENVSVYFTIPVKFTPSF